MIIKQRIHQKTCKFLRPENVLKGKDKLYSLKYLRSLSQSWRFRQTVSQLKSNRKYYSNTVSTEKAPSNHLYERMGVKIK